MTTSTFIPLREMATKLGVPISWLEQEARAGNIPYLKAGRRLLFKPEDVEQILTERATATPNEGDHA